MGRQERRILCSPSAANDCSQNERVGAHLAQLAWRLFLLLACIEWGQSVRNTVHTIRYMTSVLLFLQNARPITSHAHQTKCSVFDDEINERYLTYVYVKRQRACVFQAMLYFFFANWRTAAACADSCCMKDEDPRRNMCALDRDAYTGVAPDAALTSSLFRMGAPTQRCCC